MKIESYNSKIESLKKKLKELEVYNCRNEKEIFSGHTFIKESLRHYCKNCGLDKTQ